MAKASLLLSLLFSFFCLRLPAQPAVGHLRCEFQENPSLVDMQNPRLGWQLTGSQRNLLQTAYRVLVADDTTLLQRDVGNIWDSKKTYSNSSILIACAGKKMETAKPYFWKVMIWDNYGHRSAWSEQSSWQMGLLGRSDWKGARWIAYDTMPRLTNIVPRDTLPLLRKEFVLKGAVRRATMYISGLGQFEMSLNGNKIGDHFLDPGWTQYNQHALYTAFDLTGLLQQGKNAIGIMLGNGFYYIPSERYRKLTTAYGHPKMICRLIIQYQDGSTEDVLSDESWKAAPGPVTFSSIYGGEDYDASRDQHGWNSPGFNDSAWRQAVAVEGPPSLDAQTAEPLKIFEHFSPRRITQPRPGVFVYDLGQNASGIPFLTVKGKKGTVVKITPGELLTDSGSVTQQAIGEPVYFRYTLKGGETERWQPRFMYYGFRYIQVEGGVPGGEANPADLPVILEIQGLHTRNAAARIGDFSCSNSLFNKTFALINWAIESNMASIFTDCPHREKLGWLEQAHLMGSSIHYNYEIASLCRKIVRDMIKAQTAEGLVPDIAPEYVHFEGGFQDSPEWGSSAVILPWYLYQWFGDKEILQESYNMMRRYVDYLQTKTKEHILYFGLGDWYDIGPKPPGESQLTPAGITSTAIYYYDLGILSRIGKLLGKEKEANRFAIIATEVRTAFNRAFFNDQTKQYGTGSQTANAMAVYMSLVSQKNRAAVIDNLVNDIRAHKNSLTAGDIGYHYLLSVLDDAGRSDVIYEMNNRSDVPGYGYQLAHGATALTESWQAYPDVSNNHFMLGHLMEWFYSGICGIRMSSKAVAFHQFDIRPTPVGDLQFAKAHYLSPYGLISCEWTKTKAAFVLKVVIPANTRATIYLPARPGKRNNGRTIFHVGSGTYSFRVAP